MQIPKTLKKVWSIFTTVVVVLIVVCAIFLTVSRVVGFEVYNVISGSMAPEYNVGDLIYVKEIDPSEVSVGDPITFVLNEDLVVATHRVVSVDEENQCFYTKGDANKTEDASPVHFKNLIGVPVFKIPYLGYVSDFVQNNVPVVVIIAIVLIVAVFLPDIIEKATKKPKAEEDIPHTAE